MKTKNAKKLRDTRKSICLQTDRIKKPRIRAARICQPGKASIIGVTRKPILRISFLLQTLSPSYLIESYLQCVLENY